MDERDTPNLQASYDRVAKEYVERIFNELDDKPLDRSLLDRFAERVKDKGPACDLGCGPGHVARYLKNNDIEVFGIDLSDGMVQQARTMNPDIDFHQGDMMALELADQTLSGIAAFYSIIHIPRHAVVDALIEMKRVLQVGG
ncbi:MAG: class I SAM-dependent methyltransferase, partial [Pyrinomonadaceae bacterium]